MSRIRTILFDLDGTLIDSKDLILSSFRHTMETHRGSALPDEAWLATMGRPLVVQLREFASDEAEVEAMLATYLEHNLSHHDGMVRSYPGIADTVSRLRDDGYALGIVTSKQLKGTLRGLRSCGLSEEWFGSIVTADDVTRGKPDPEPLHIALREMEEADPGRAVYIGDSIHDMQAGGAAGTRTAAALWGPYEREILEPARPDYWLDRIEDVWSILA